MSRVRTAVVAACLPAARKLPPAVPLLARGGPAASGLLQAGCPCPPAARSRRAGAGAQGPSAASRAALAQQPALAKGKQKLVIVPQQRAAALEASYLLVRPLRCSAPLHGHGSRPSGLRRERLCNAPGGPVFVSVCTARASASCSMLSVVRPWACDALNRRKGCCALCLPEQGM